MQVIDLSVGGCLVATDEPAPAGSEVTLRVTLGGIEVGLAGRVVHVRAGRAFAVEFRHLSAAEQQQLEEFLEEADRPQATS